MTEELFNPLAGNFSSVAWIAPDDDYRLKIADIRLNKVTVENVEKWILNFSIRIADGEFEGRKTQDITCWEPNNDFSQAAKVIVSALGYIPGKDDARFQQDKSSLDLTIDFKDEGKLGAGYAEVKDAVFVATLTSTTSKKNGQLYQNYKNIRPLNS